MQSMEIHYSKTRGAIGAFSAKNDHDSYDKEILADGPTWTEEHN